MKHVKSSLPRDAVEKTVREYSPEASPYAHRVVDCLCDGIQVGQRVYNRGGIMIVETPLKNGLKHGREFTWDEDGKLMLVEPYSNGKIHGTAKQYGKEGNVIGTYSLVHGTGLDVWRQENEDKTVFVSEIYCLQDGVPHGYEWHFTPSQKDLWQERHWHMGRLHGIERVWNSKGRLRRGYPKFYALDLVVSRQKYLKSFFVDRTLPIYREEDNLPCRNFSTEIQELMSQTA